MPPSASLRSISRGPRSANVVTNGPGTLYTLLREAFDQLRRERCDLAAAFGDFLLRTLADRLTLTRRLVPTLSG
ncbi:MAG: hypothetical protein KBC94_00760 [Pseudacidovorax sp.]|uniref:hypothetical protein n=1 Tax=Pseudacidovorax sp. TaxID=1934311 RepID=UPI001B744716|nr:hypothetical protein [Pseudacidovorax sp.]MBP6892924.1 hypothetical protein [Pseudacidovorax sp.]